MNGTRRDKEGGLYWARGRNNFYFRGNESSTLGDPKDYGATV
jgi:hypothetical protein